MTKYKRMDYALESLKREMEKYPGAMNNPSGFIEHSRGVSNIACEDTARIVENYPSIPLLVEEIAIAGVLHDIGRPRNLIVNGLGQLGHEIESERILAGDLELSPTRDKLEVKGIGRAVGTHSSVYEQWIAARETKDPRYSGLLKAFGDLDPSILKPTTWNQAIITWADLCDKNGGRVDPIWKLNDAVQRYKKDPKIADPIVVLAHQNAMDRLTSLCNVVDDAIHKRLTEDLSTYFGFL